MYSKSGKIAGWTINSDKLSSSNVTLSSKTGANEKAININNGTFYVQNNGYMNASNANVNGTITTTNLTASGTVTINDAKINNASIKTATVDDATLTNCRISAGQITSGVLNSARIPNLDAGKINTGTLSGRKIECGNSYINGDGNSFQFTNNTAWLSMNTASTHLWASAINVEAGNGVNFYTGSVSSVGTFCGQIQGNTVSGLELTAASGKQIRLNSTVNIKSGLVLDGTKTPTGVVKIMVGADFHYIVVKHGIIIDVKDTNSGYAEIWNYQ